VRRAVPARSHLIRSAAILLASRIRIALPYRPATSADLTAVAAALADLSAEGLPNDDDAVEELRQLEQTLEILVPPAQR